MNVDKKQARETNAYRLLVVVLAKRASATCISSKSIIKLLSSGTIPKTPAFLEPPSCHNALLFVRVSLGRVQEEQVENVWSIRFAPLATMTTRAPQAIYLE
jgi:hypothetical protein